MSKQAHSSQQKFGNPIHVDNKLSTERFLAATGMANNAKHVSGQSSQPNPRSTWQHNSRPDDRNYKAERDAPLQPPKASNIPPVLPPRQLYSQVVAPRATPSGPRPPQQSQKPRPFHSQQAAPHTAGTYQKNLQAAQQHHHAPEGVQHPSPQQRGHERERGPPHRWGPANPDESSTGAEIISLTKVEMPSPDLAAYHVPRINKKCEGSPSRSPPSVSSIGTQNTDNDRVAMGNKDIRNKIAPANGFVYDADTGSWIKNCEYDSISYEGTFRGLFVHEWVKLIPCDISAELRDDKENGVEHWRCDIDTDTGKLIPPVEYPKTLPTPVCSKNGFDWRRQTWTSSLLMRRRAITKPVQEGTPEWEAIYFTPEEMKEREERDRIAREEWEKKVALLPQYNKASPRVPCYLRPADLADMAQVAAIYNWEVQHGLQAVDSEPLSVTDFTDLCHRTCRSGMPFFVAVYGSAKHVKIEQSSVFYSDVIRHPDALVAPDPKKVGKILGFAFLTVWEPGLVGSTMGASRASGKAHIFVHADFLRKRIGYSLMDRILCTTSRRHWPSRAYDFVDTTNGSAVYGDPDKNVRRYYHIYTTFFVKHRHWDDGNSKLKAIQAKYEDELKYVQAMLTDGFNFSVEGRFKMSHRTPKSRPGPVVWLDSVVFEHCCQMAIDEENDLPGEGKY